MTIKRFGWITIGVVLVVACAFLPSRAVAAEAAGVHPEMIVSAKWLAEHLNDPKVVVLHVADKRSEYDAGHIPGARFLSLDDFIEGQDAELPTTEKLKDTFEKLGVSDDSRVVIYTTAWYPMAGRAYYTLDYLGHGDHTALLDGGIDEWRVEKRALATDTPKVARGSFTPHLHPEVRAALEDVKKISEQAPKSDLLCWIRDRRSAIPTGTLPEPCIFTGRRRWLTPRTTRSFCRRTNSKSCLLPAASIRGRSW